MKDPKSQSPMASEGGIGPESTEESDPLGNDPSHSPGRKMKGGELGLAPSPPRQILKPMIANHADLPILEMEGIRRVAVVVAHPDDEALWAGGLLLGHPEWRPFIVSLCRGHDPDRAPKFFKALGLLNAQGIMGDLDDGPDQVPLPGALVRETILSLLPRRDFELLLTHAPDGEYTRHRRHEEVSRAVMALWRGGELRASWLWQFAYEDGGRSYAPRPRQSAAIQFPLSDELLARKSAMIADVYGFSATSWEARAVTGVEAFHCFYQDDSIPPKPQINPPPKL